jgi:hypothetical protein
VSCGVSVAVGTEVRYVGSVVFQFSVVCVAMRNIHQCEYASNRVRGLARDTGNVWAAQSCLPILGLLARHTRMKWGSRLRQAHSVSLCTNIWHYSHAARPASRSEAVRDRFVLGRKQNAQSVFGSDLNFDAVQFWCEGHLARQARVRRIERAQRN